ncbi:hypothetical protein V5799_014676 [Amblyomma americanum]|uniref:Tick transposon n=1 Tax=Amblyomma americanum TaxID=6943 RepID=A0AAQ4E2B9_AMBAM
MSRTKTSSQEQPTITRQPGFFTEPPENMEEDFHDNIDVTHVPRGHDGLVATGTQAPGCSTPSTLQRPQVNGMDADKAEGWAVVQSKKSKRRQNGGDKPQILAGNGAGRSPSSDEAGRSAAGAPEKKQWEGGPRLRLPPLPKDDIKIVLRPRGLAVKDLPQYKVVEAVVAATGRGCKEEDLLVRLRHGSNIIIVSTANEDAAKKVLHIRQINFGGKSFAVNTHAAAPEGTLRGVIHGPAPKTTSEELKAHIRLRTQGVRVITARMLGNSSTALITFDGPTLPKFVIYHSSEYRCHPYRPTRQVCYTCGQQGHRMDVCPNPNAKVCRQCGLQNPTTEHQCTPKCLVCDGDHITGTRDCKQRLKSACELRWGPLQQQRKSRDRSRRRRPRWFRDESQESGRSGSRGRSRNRSRSRGSERDESFPPLGQQQQEQKQGQEQQKKKKTGGVKGNSVSPDTCPDLTFVRGARQVEWENLLENLGSDHYILKTSITAEDTKRKIGKTRLVDWDAFRAHCRQMQGGDIVSVGEWSQQLKEVQELYTKEVDRTEHAPEVDKRLLKLWEARRGLTARWKRQKLNRKLKTKIAEITKQAEEYATQLARQGWQQFSNALNGTLSTARTWQILKSLMDPSKNKSESGKAIRRLVHQYTGTDKQLLEEVRVKCYGNDQVECYKEEYQGEENPVMDKPITREEVVDAIRSATRNTAAGADRIRNSLIRNLSDGAIDQLTAYLNKLWQEGTVPAEWKHAVVVMIPKPGKKLQVENLRPISLTSCLGKMYERIITKRIQSHLERNQLYPDSMYGFRAHLSTQDVLLQLKEEVLEKMPRSGENVVMALDIKGAFDNVSHAAIMEGINDTNCGRRAHNYIRAFLSNRTATVGLAELRSDVFATPCKGTPQGSVISPVLFNMSMLRLARKLKEIPGIKHAMYADDITVWITQGSLGEKQDRLQEAATCVEEYVKERGLKCSTEKSELIRIGRHPTQAPLDVVLEGQPIPEKNIIRILGMWLQSSRKCSHTITLLRKATEQEHVK